MGMCDRKILCITRHSWRGVEHTNSQTIKLSDDLVVPSTFISWNKNISEYGKDLVNIKIIEGALNEYKINCDKKNFWNEIRVNMTKERTFETGKIMRKQFKEQKKYEVSLTRVIDDDASDKNSEYNYKNYDFLVSDIDVFKKIPQYKESENNINEDKYKSLTKKCLDFLSLSINKTPFKDDLTLPLYDDDNNINLFYTRDVYNVTDMINMLTYNKPPLNQIYNTDKIYKYQYELIMSSLEWHGYYNQNNLSKQTSAYVSLPIINYLNEMEYGNNKILVTHDSRQLQLLYSLEIPIFKYDIPFQSYIIVQTRKNVKIIYVAQKLSRKTCTFQKNKYVTKLIWEGSIRKWNRKIEKMQTYIIPEYPEVELKQAHPLHNLG